MRKSKTTDNETFDYFDRKFAVKNKIKEYSTIKKIFLCLAALATAIVIILTATIVIIAHNLPNSQEILAHKPSIATVIYDRNGDELARLFLENRNIVKLDNISPWMTKAILAAEDSSFYEHSGIRPIAIVRAAFVNIFHLGAHQGGSTITQQLARNLFLSSEKTMLRKIREAILSLRIENVYSKDQILELYLNTIYMGHGNYGIDSAAQHYFGKHAKDLDIAESATLAGLIAAPEKYSPIKNPNLSNIRKLYVLKRMLDLDWISQADYNKAAKPGKRAGKGKRQEPGIYISHAPYFVNYLLFKHLLPTYGADMVYRGGLKIYTTIDMKVQEKAEQLISKMPHEGALVSLNPETGEIIAMVGGRNFSKSQFNRATQAYQQPGSSFKPFVYVTALEKGYRAVDHLLDAPLRIGEWTPSNYNKGKYSGEVSFMTALAKSLNTPAARLGEIITVDSIVDMSVRLGFSDKYLSKNLTISLGSSGVTPLQMCIAYSVFANNGYRVKPYGVMQIENNAGKIIERNQPDIKNVISTTTAVTMRSLLEQVMRWGTGANMNISGYQCFGKTGTTNNWTRAWFVGGAPKIVTAIYTGNDNNTSMGGHATGTSAAGPVWRAFMSYAVKQLKTPPSFTLPSDAAVEEVRVCKQTGFIASSGCRATTILLPAGSAPSAYCPWHGGSSAAAKSDSNAPQLLLASVDDESTRYKYRSIPSDEIEDDEMYQDSNKVAETIASFSGQMILSEDTTTVDATTTPVIPQEQEPTQPVHTRQPESAQSSQQEKHEHSDKHQDESSSQSPSASQETPNGDNPSDSNQYEKLLQNYKNK